LVKKSMFWDAHRRRYLLTVPTLNMLAFMFIRSETVALCSITRLEERRTNLNATLTALVLHFYLTSRKYFRPPCEPLLDNGATLTLLGMDVSFRIPSPFRRHFDGQTVSKRANGIDGDLRAV